MWVQVPSSAPGALCSISQLHKNNLCTQEVGVVIYGQLQPIKWCGSA